MHDIEEVDADHTFEGMEALIKNNILVSTIDTDITQSAEDLTRKHLDQISTYQYDDSISTHYQKAKSKLSGNIC